MLSKPGMFDNLRTQFARKLVKYLLHIFLKRETAGNIKIYNICPSGGMEMQKNSNQSHVIGS